MALNVARIIHQQGSCWRLSLALAAEAGADLCLTAVGRKCCHYGNYLDKVNGSSVSFLVVCLGPRPMNLSLASARGLLLLATALLVACVDPSNEVISGGGTPDITQCGVLAGAGDARDPENGYVPAPARRFGEDGREHPDVFFLAWAKLDERLKLSFPARGYDGDGFEDKLYVTREEPGGGVSTWQLLPLLDESCEDEEQIRIHSFDVGPDGNTLYLSMRRDDDTHLGIYEFNIKAFTFEKISPDEPHHFLNPTYVGDENGHPQLFVAKTVSDKEIPNNYYKSATLVDEYDRAATPLIHKLDTVTGDLFRVGLNNSHQLEPVLHTRPDGQRLVVFTQWEHQDSTNRFALWKMQSDGSDNFTFFGQESSTDKGSADLYGAREIKSGPYQGHMLMGEGARGSFVSEGNVIMTERVDLDLRSDKIYLQRMQSAGDGGDSGIARNPEHFNDESFIYSYRANQNHTYDLCIKDYPVDGEAADMDDPGKCIADSPFLHLVQARSYLPPAHAATPVYDGAVGDSRSSFSNNGLAGNAGFLTQKMNSSDNGVQQQLDGVAADQLGLRFIIPSHTFPGQSVTVAGGDGARELSVPASDYLPMQEDGSFGAVLRPGLYAWQVAKKFDRGDDGLAEDNIWIPVRVERQEINFVANRVNACNQCHQERDQANIEFYENFDSIATRAMKNGSLRDPQTGAQMPDITADADYAYDSVPDFHRQIVPLLEKPPQNAAGLGGESCVDCHHARDALNLSNRSGPSALNSTYLRMLKGARLLAEGRDDEGEPQDSVQPFSYQSINPMGMDNNYHPAPLLWSLLLDDDLSVAPAEGYADGNRNLDRDGDYGARYSVAVNEAIAAINAEYDHSQHWSTEDTQAFINFSATQFPVGLSDRIEFEGAGSAATAAAQKAFQVIVNNCYSCHHDLAEGGVDKPLAEGGARPKSKRFNSEFGLRDGQLRLVERSHKARESDLGFSQYLEQSNLENALQRTMTSALYRIDFDNPSDSELLTYPSNDNLNANIQHPQVLSPGSSDYNILLDWILGEVKENQAPQLDQGADITLRFSEYDDPAYRGDFQWSDPDGDLAQLLIEKVASSEHIPQDSFVSLVYNPAANFNSCSEADQYSADAECPPPTSFTEAKAKTYAILGDRGTHTVNLTVTDGHKRSSYPVNIEISKGDYDVPAPQSSLPNAYAYFTERDTGLLKKIESDGSETTISETPLEGYNENWSTVYRRPPSFSTGGVGWLYFMEQTAQKIHVVNEDTAEVMFVIDIDHAPNRESDKHKQTTYLLWWRPDDSLLGGGELQALQESKHGSNRNGIYYVGLGNGGQLNQTVVPQYRSKLEDGQDSLSVYVWRKATFMTKLVQGGVDRFNVLNLVTGKAKGLTDFSFPEKTVNGITYPARDYFNVRAVVTSGDGAFYGFNQDAQALPEMFQFDPLEQIQRPVVLPEWLASYMVKQQSLATPFLVIEPRS